MNHKIANIFKGYIDDLAWVDKIAGLVQTAHIRIKDGDSAVEKSYPVSCDITADACIAGEYQSLTPESSKKSVVYFEDGGVDFIERVGNRLKFKSSLRLVAWLNLREINRADCDADSGNCAVSGDYVIDVIKVLPTVPISTADFVSIHITSISQAERSVSIFSKYTYSEFATQYLMYPYDYFALDLSIDFVIPCQI